MALALDQFFVQLIFTYLTIQWGILNSLALFISTWIKTGELYDNRPIKNTQILVSFAICIDIMRILPYRQIL